MSIAPRCNCGEFCRQERQTHRALVEMDAEFIGALSDVQKQVNSIAALVRSATSPQPSRSEAN